VVVKGGLLPDRRSGFVNRLESGSAIPSATASPQGGSIVGSPPGSTRTQEVGEETSLLQN
jgi:hypothetical protein